MTKKQRVFFYLLCLWYVWALFEQPDYIRFVRHTVYAENPAGFYAYAVFSYLELIYMAILTVYLGSTPGIWGRKFAAWFWQMLLSFVFITPVLRLFCPLSIGPGESLPEDKAMARILLGIPWAVWSVWGLYHLYKYPVLPRAEKIFHRLMGILFGIILFVTFVVLITGGRSG